MASSRDRPREYSSFKHARYRCSSPKCDKWAEYGGRGIKFLFESFDQFLEALGQRPEGTSLERIDGNGDYRPGNVRWATKSEQGKNRRSWKRCQYS